MTKNEVSEMLLHLKEECNKHPKAKSIKCNKWELLEIADYFLDLVGRIELLSVSEEFNKEEYLIENMTHKFANNLVKYLDVKVIDDPLTNSFVYKANLCVLKRKEY